MTMTRLALFVRRLTRMAAAGSPASGGEIPRRKRDDDTVAVLLSRGMYSLDGGETWFYSDDSTPV